MVTPPPDSLLAAARADSARAAARLAAALRALVELPGWSPVVRTATDLKRATGISHRVSWQLHRVAMSEEPLAEARHMPRRAAFEKLCRAAEAAGAPSEALAEARAALAAFEKTVATVAGDRETFAEMVDGWSGKQHSDAALQNLRAAHRANRQVWGISAKVSFMTFVALPAPHDWFMLRGYCALRSARRAKWDVFVNAGHGIDGSSPLGIEAGEGTGMLTSYCRGPIPRLEQRQDDDRQIVTAEFDVSGEVTPHTLVFGQRTPAVDRTSMRGRLHGGFPVERRVIDLLAHRSLEPSLERHGILWPNNTEFAPMNFIPHEVQQFPDASLVSGFRELSSYRDLLVESLGAAGFALEDFALVRATGEYLPAGSVLELKLGLGSEGGEG